MKKTLVLVASVLFSNWANAYFEITDTGKKPREMNGIFYDNYKDFTKKWHLVTVRYRQDSGELRFTYANDLAFNAMKKLKPNYPDGAMFGKVGFTTEDDPSFSSSKVPSGAKRYQLMLKDKKKYAESDGWGYALFDNKGNLFQEDIVAKTQSCVACHRIVPERDYVFSRPMLLHSDSVSPLISGGGSEKIVQFEKLELKRAPAELTKFTAPFDIYNSMTGALQTSAFAGTLDEVVPLLTDKSRKTNAPSALFLDKDNFSLVIPKKDSKKCLEQNSLLQAFRIVVQFNSKLIRDTEACL